MIIKGELKITFDGTENILIEGKNFPKIMLPLVLPLIDRLADVVNDILNVVEIMEDEDEDEDVTFKEGVS